MIRLVLFLLVSFTGLAASAQTCGSRLFASGYFSTVHVYDACTGQFLRELDSGTRLQGAQAIRVGPDGFIYVVAEQASTIFKYRADTLEFAGTFAVTPAMGPLSLDFSADGTAYVAGYNSNDVKKFDRNGTLIGPAFAARASGIAGPEIGTMFGPDGNLYVPGYNSASVIKYDPRTGITSVAIAAGANGISRPRGLLLNTERTHLFVITEGSGQLLRYRLSDGVLTEVRRGLVEPTMAAYAPDGKLLIVNNGAIQKLDPDTGATLSTFVAAGSGGLAGPTFIAVVAIPATPVVDATQVGSQYWVVGDTKINGRVIDLTTVYSATGTGFGTNLKFSEISVKRWGAVRIELLSCMRARFTWNSTGADTANFGSGEYELQRYFANENDARCSQSGLDDADKSWISGQWWGGDARAGEGVFLDRRSDGTVFFAWFTHRPASGATPDASQVGTQYWVVSTANVANRVIAFNDVYSANGSVFGPNLKFSDLAVKRWGSIRVEFLSCRKAKFSWNSTGTGTAGFGSGEYEVDRFMINESTARCDAAGIDAADKSWMNGHWWGGDARSGEGWFLDRRADGTVFLAWFTHRPR
ncbi:MAG: hypothetical protein ABI905_11855 [Betaproteobacteria bacterium]